jgi:hypothetical protein
MEELLGAKLSSMPSKHPRIVVAEAELEAGRNRRTAAVALFEAMDDGHFDLDPAAIDRLNEPMPG